MYKLNPKQIEILKALGYTDPQITGDHIWAFRNGEVMPVPVDNETLLEIEFLDESFTFKRSVQRAILSALWSLIRVIGAIATRRTKFCAIAIIAGLVVAIAHGVTLLIFIGVAIVLSSLLFDVLRGFRSGEFWRFLERFGGDR